MENAPVVFTYTRQDAINDGVIIELPPLLTHKLFKIPVSITCGIAGLIGLTENENVIEPLLAAAHDEIMDVLLFQKDASVDRRGDRVYFDYQGEKVLALCHPDDNGNAVLTIMLPLER